MTDRPPTFQGLYLPVEGREYGCALYPDGTMVVTDMTAYFAKCTPPLTPEERLAKYVYEDVEGRRPHQYIVKVSFDDYCDLREYGRILGIAPEPYPESEVEDPIVEAKCGAYLTRLEELLLASVVPQVRLALRASHQFLLVLEPKKKAAPPSPGV